MTTLFVILAFMTAVTTAAVWAARALEKRASSTVARWGERQGFQLIMQERRWMIGTPFTAAPKTHGGVVAAAARWSTP